MTADNIIGTLALLVVLPVLIVWLFVWRRQHLKYRWKESSVAAKVELSIAKKSNTIRFVGELAVLLVMAVFVAEILTSSRLVKDEGFIWLVIGLPICFLLGRFWWRNYR